MSSFFVHSYLWEKGESPSSYNPYTLVMEQVMTEAGEVFFALISTDDELAGRLLLWFYEDAVTLLCHYGLHALMARSFHKTVRSYCKKEYPPDYAVVLCNKKHFFAERNGDLDVRILRKGDTFRPKKQLGRKRKNDAFFLCPASFYRVFSEKTVSQVLGKKNHKMQSAPEIHKRLQELRRREISRVGKKKTGMIYVR